jgi:hypothetical protein
MAAYNEGDPNPRRKVKSIKGYDSPAEFLLEMRKRYASGRGTDEHNERAGRDDAKFVIGEQWDPDVERKRRDQKKPVLTINRLIAFVAQVVNNRLMNETEIRVHPDKAGTKEIAEIREGLIRSIYKNSYADLARDEALKYQVIGGQGAFCLSIDYVSDDVFEQEIRLKQVADPYAIVLDPMATEPTGGDAEWGFVGDDLPRETFKKKWPWASIDSFDSGFQSETTVPWITEDVVRVIAYWRMVTEGTKILALYQDGTVHDVTDMEEFEYLSFVATRGDGVTPYIREVPNRFARMYLCSGNEVLEGPYDYPISSIPIYRVPGWEVSDGERTYRWGLTRFLKDPQRFHNYWRSVQAEQLVAAPRNKWLTTPAAVKGFEKNWRNSPTSDNPFLYYQDGEQPPIHIPPPGIDGALLQEAGMATQDIRDVSNIHEASMGQQSNEVSGKAIQQRQIVSDVGTYIYHDRLRLADERCAKNINELIPHIYDTARIVTIIGQDDKPLLQVINDPSNPNSDITAGKYAVTVTVGPATVTKRALAAEQMMAFVNAVPETAGQVMDLVAEAQDWPKAGEFARRFRMMLPPGMVPQDEMTPEMQQQAAQNAEMAQMQAQLDQAMAEAEISGKQAKASNDEARARLAEAQAYKAILDAQSRASDVSGKNEEREYQQVMNALDQDNTLKAEDRDFDLRSREMQSRNNGEQDDG